MTQSAKVGSTDAALTKVIAGTEGGYVSTTGAVGTLTVAQLIDGVLDCLSGTPGTATTPTAAQIVAAIPGCAVGSRFDFTVVNNSGATVTLAGGTGVTLTGSGAVSTAVVTRFCGVVTNVTASSEAVKIGAAK